MSTRDAYVEGIKSAFQKIGEEALKKAILAKLPFLANAFFNPLVSLFVSWILKTLLGHAETAVFFLYIDMRVAGQSEDFNKAIAENLKAQQSGTPEEKKNAEENLKMAFRKFIMLRN